MNLNFDLNHVAESLTQKLANAELQASQFEAVAIYKDKKIKELEKELEQYKKEKGADE